MCTRAKRWGTALTVAVVLLMACVGVASAGQVEDQDILDLFKQGMTEYRTGEYEQAQKTFDRLLAMEPGMQAALRMRGMADLGVMFEMKEKGELGPQAEKLLDLMMRAGREAKREVENPEQLVEDLASEDAQTYGRAQVTLKGHGPYAVPYVLPLLEQTDPERQHVVGRAVGLLGTMQRDACLPLIEALANTDDSLLKTRIAGVLGQLGDPRALPVLMAVAQNGPAADAAAQAIQQISGMQPAELDSVVTQYMEFGLAYFFEDKARVGYTFGTSADIWQWNAEGETLPEKLTYEMVPNYLYYQRMATELALDGLAVAPGDAELRSLLAAALVRQMALCEYFRTSEFRFGGRDLTEQTQQDAAERAEKFGLQIPIVLRMLDAPTVAGALELALDAESGPAALYLVKALGTKLAATRQVPQAETADALVAAMNSGDRDVRYNAAIVLTASCPDGTCGPADQTMDVLAAALQAAAQRRALVVINDFQTRNSLAGILREQGVGTVETRAHEGSIESALYLEPSVDAIFFTGNLPDLLFGRVLEMLKSDPRTKDLPLYVVMGPGETAADVADYEGVDQVMTADDIRLEKLEPIIQDVLSESRSAFTDEEETVVLKAVAATNEVDPADTAYPLAVLEPPLVQALRGYSEEVTAGVIDALASFGTGESLKPLGRIVASGSTQELKIAACEAMAAIMRRTLSVPPQTAEEALIDALAGEDQALRRAAAEALGTAGLEAETQMDVLRSEGLNL
jgi:HEAT repeat protein